MTIINVSGLLYGPDSMVYWAKSPINLIEWFIGYFIQFSELFGFFFGLIWAFMVFFFFYFDGIKIIILLIILKFKIFVYKNFKVKKTLFMMILFPFLTTNILGLNFQEL